jgi:hypothetical protein
MSDENDDVNSREHLLFRAACLRDAQRSIAEPTTLDALIQALEEAAAKAEQVQRLHRLH